MSQSPRETDVEQQAPSPDADEQQSLTNRHGEMADTGLGFDFEVKEQDRWLPIANGALPENAKIAKEAKECMQECVSEFISFITSEASEKCQQEKRKTVNGEDILFAMTSLGFENYAEALKIYLARYRETLVARGEHQRPSAGASGANPTTSPEYEGPGGSAGMPGDLEGAQGGGEFTGYGVGQSEGGDY
ncbi:transcriptional activator hap3 [Zalaria obscura]|uniref:Transcriptional activator hap3 n=1 Tax=Zalaria obscura TaxID=2024903 RepID=A0ACC3SM77_9PEZI